MSRIYFHSLSREEVVGGPERHWAGSIIGNLFVGLINVDSPDDNVLKLLPAGHYVGQRQGANALGAALVVRSDFALWAGFGFDRYFMVEGEKIPVFDCQLNTAIDFGSDTIIFLARLHGQCEIHGYVEGKNRKWLADIIEEGVETKLLRVWKTDEKYGHGWLRVIDMLRERDDEAVVTSYSVTDQFPNPHISGIRYDSTKDDDEKYEEDYEKSVEAWYDLPSESQWTSAMKGLREQGNMLEWKPETWRTDWFGAGYTALSLRDYADRTFSTGDNIFTLNR